MHKSLALYMAALTADAPMVLVHSVAREARGACEPGPGAVATLGAGAAVAAAAALGVGIGWQRWCCMHACKKLNKRLWQPTKQT